MQPRAQKKVNQQATKLRKQSCRLGFLMEIMSMVLVFTAAISGTGPVAAAYPPVVSIVATDAEAAQRAVDGITNTATFTISRTGSTNDDLGVWLTFGGTATYGADYQVTPVINYSLAVAFWTAAYGNGYLPDDVNTNIIFSALTPTVVIPAGAREIQLTVWPTDRPSQAATNTVQVQVWPPELPPATNFGPITVTGSNSFPMPPNYSVDPNAGNATIVILNNDPPPPVLSIVATDAEAAKRPINDITNTATFTISRTGPTNDDMGVWFSVGGTANFGGDYQLTPAVNNFSPAAESFGPDGFGTVTFLTAIPTSWFPIPTAVIPAGANSIQITVWPLDNATVGDSSTVSIQLLPPIEPYNPMPLRAFSPWAWPPQPDYLPVPWIPPYTNDPNTSLATAVILNNDPPHINQAPVIDLIGPINGTSVPAAPFNLAPSPVALTAKAYDPDGVIIEVDFFVNGALVFSDWGASSNGVYSGEWYPDYWDPNDPGIYTLTAMATDNAYATTVSAPVLLNVGKAVTGVTNPIPVITNTIPVVTNSIPVVSNGIPVVTISATDQYAIEPLPYLDPDFANFTVTRLGPTDAPLTVFYSISGTATNGADYVALPGSVTIPAGSDSADITVIPLDHLKVDGAQSIILTLSPSPENSVPNPLPSPYVIGSQSSDTVWILDMAEGPPAPPGLLPGQQSLSLSPTKANHLSLKNDSTGHLTATGNTGDIAAIEVSTDLVHWTYLTHGLIRNGQFSFTDPGATNARARFYRALVP